MREFYAGIGRRSGKTTFCSKLGVYLLSQDYTAKLTAGEVATVACLAPTVDQSSILFRRMEATVTESPLLAAQASRITNNMVEFCHRTSLEVVAASFRSTRGPTYAGVILDEAAYLRSEESATPDIEIIRAVRPGLATLNGWLIVLSSPYMRRGALWNAYRKHFGNNDSPALYVEGPTSLFNPVLDGGVIASAYEDDPEAAAAEWGGQFRHDLSAALDPAWIDGAIDSGVYERGRVTMLPEGRALYYVSFTDPAGGSGKDSWCTRVVHVEGNGIVDDGLLEIRPPFNTSEAAKQTADFLKSYGITSTTGDRYAGSWPADALRAHGVGYTPSERNKSEIYRECIPLFSSGRVRLLEHSRTINQLRMLERRVRSGGADNIDHPAGGNDDLANALCGALLLASRGAGAGESVVWSERSTIWDNYERDTMPAYLHDPSQWHWTDEL